MGIFDWFKGKTPSRDEFAALVQTELKKAGRPSVYDAEQFRLTLGTNHYAFLANFYAEFCSVEKDKRSLFVATVVKNIANISDDLPTDFEEAKTHLRPRLWMRGMMSKTKLHAAIDGGGGKLSIAEYPIGSHMVATLVYDLPDMVKTIPNEQFEEWGTTYYQALEIAVENLAQTSFQCLQLGEGLYICDNRDSYDASRLLLNEFVTSLEVKGDLVAMCPNRDLLLITGSDDDESLQAMLKVTEEALKNPRPMSGIVLRRVGDEWVDWLPSRGHELYDSFKMLQVQFLTEEYGDQKQLLEKLYAKGGVDRFVANYTGVKSGDGDVFSYSVWSKDVPTMLPKTDMVFFFIPGQEGTTHARWEDVERLAGELLVEEENLYPARYFATEFPSDDLLAKLKR